MCTRPTPSYRSVTASAAALGVSVLDLVKAVVLLLVALAGAPLRHLGRFGNQWRPAPSAHVDVQVHLGDAACVAELEAIVWKTLARAERTWAPLPLPVHRVVIGAGFPATGRADIYDDFLEMAHAKEGVTGENRRRVVVSLGVRDGTRDMDGWEIAGVLAAQIQILVDGRCRQHKRLGTLAGVVQTTNRLVRPPVEGTEPTGLAAQAPDGLPVTALDAETRNSPPADDVPSLAALVADMQKDPLGSGPPRNGTHV
jgi:hypothetical protein